MIPKNQPPRIFNDVLHAISELRDVNGSTIKTIVEQLREGFPKRRNMVTQVRKALRHGITSGILKQKAGKYKLTFLKDTPAEDQNILRKPSPQKVRTAKCKCKKPRKSQQRPKRCVPPPARKCKPPNRRPKPRRRRKKCKRSASLSTTTGKSRNKSHSRSGSSTSSSIRQSSEIKISGRPKRNVWGVSKTKKIEKPQTNVKKPQSVKVEKKIRKPPELKKDNSREPVDPDQDQCTNEVNREDESKEPKKEPEKKDENQGEEQEEQQDSDTYMDYNNDQAAEIPQCDNPDCLCRLKQEPDDDMYEND